MPDGSKNGHLKNIIIDDNSKKKANVFIIYCN